MTNANKEIELKYLVSAQCSPKKLAVALHAASSAFGFDIDPLDQNTLHDVYYDNDNNDLERAGWTLRVRADHNSTTLTLKSVTATSGLFRRTELEESFPRKLTVAKDQLHIPEKSHIRRYMTDMHLPISMLQPVYQHENKRYRYRITHSSDPATSIQWAVDKVEVKGSDVSYAEFEFELESGSESVLQHLRLIADTIDGLYPSRMSKLVRGVYAHQPEEFASATLSPLLPSWQTHAITAVKQGISKLIEAEPFAYEAIHPEGVHQLRIAIRRTNSALDLFSARLPAQTRQNIDGQLAQLMKHLGRVRDNDVHRAQLKTYLDKKKWRAYKRFLNRAQLDNQRHLRQMLDSKFAILNRDLSNLLTYIEKSAANNNQITAPAAKTAIDPALNAVLSSAKAITQTSSGKELHRFRIQIKQLRYQLELLEKPDARAEDLINQTSKLQTMLGHHQDAQVARSRIKKYLRGKSKTEKAALNQFVAKQRDLAKKYRRKISKASTALINSASNSQHPCS